MDSWALLALLAIPWAGGLLVAVLPRHRGKLAGAVALMAAIGSTLALGVVLGRGGVETELFVRRAWIRDTGVGLALRLDALALPFVVVVLGVSVFAIAYGLGYLRGKRDLTLCYALILGFMGSMLGSVLSANVFLFLVFWESMLVTSSLLLAGWGEGQKVGPITLKYFIYTQVGSLLLLVCMARLAGLARSTRIEDIMVAVSRLTVGQRAGVASLLLVGFCVKMAIFPLHTWLPDAHSIAPMPVTIMLAAAMLSMGAYGILRFPLALLGVEAMALIQLPLMLFALVSQVYGALMCLACRDIKRLVAYSSVSQMGYVLFAYASLTPKGIAGGTFHVISHAIVKSALFMGVGLIIHRTGRRRIDELGGLSQAMPRVAAGMAIGAIAIAAVPPFCGFHGEWMIVLGGLTSTYPLLGYLELLAPVMTAAYAIRFAVQLALGPQPEGLETRDSPLAMRWSFYLLLALALLVGIIPGPIYGWVNRVAAFFSLGSQ